MSSHGASFQTLFKQPKSAWAVAFACIVAFMGIGLVDPILPAIAEKLNATPSQVSLLFTSYMVMTGITMLVTGWVSSRIGPKPTLLFGLLAIIVFAFMGGMSNSVTEIVWYRAGWGLGNAFFISTALAVIVSVASGGTAGAIVLYEAAIGLGMSVGPLLGGLLGGISWRGPFFGVSVLMAIAFLAVFVLLNEVPAPKRRSSISDPLRALTHRGLFTLAATALLYNYGFFTLLAFSPFVLHMDEHSLGFVFFFWGVMLAITSVIIAPLLQRKYGSIPTLNMMLFLLAIVLAVMGFGVESQTTLVVAIVIAGAILGIINTVLTTAVMDVAPVERAVASSAYSFVRFSGGALAPWLAGKLAEWYSPHVPFYAGAVAVIVSILVLAVGKKVLAHVN
ncbi:MULTISPECIES: MFS transporter [Brevibacillus]|uniref:MFS transporter n=1 Tax=Brevibacillus TaxID=55080 RepID=UPI0004F23770|nr:MFS transporter [Brevibacillus borstelensis]KKX56091.1 MFS transporter [Brevibacillus borstelensis cifa_chp40]MED1743695.1 MFS transporter [Brevibacillus borstelensis]MED1872104.1 MFS transporter [Brevibacillus borstelensis]MED2008299.1 MFS transporter [Brevibacillus borstelensis]